jgi:poly-gamma-glutamate synthesis protein (capsule biosynthesis protein)
MERDNMKRINKLLLLISAFVLLVSCTNNQNNQDINKNNDVNTKYELSMIMAGDALIHNGVYLDAYEGNDFYNFKPMFEDIKPVVSSYDLAFYNQETVIGGKKIGLSTYPRFNSPEEIGDALVDAGFNMISLSNNHTLDRGEEAITNSINYWKDKDVVTSGSYLSFEERNKISVHKKNNIRYAMLAYTTTTNGLRAPIGKEYLVNTYNDEIVKEDIERIKDYTDVIIVSMHWGVEYTHTPTQEQKRIAEYLSSLGVTIVIGHHPHVIQPIEFINDTLVVYSLGNFISAQVGTPKLIGMLVSLNIVKSIDNNEISVKIEDVKGDLIYTYYDNFKNFKVIPFNNLNDDLLNNYKQIETQYTSIINQYDKTIKVGIFE